MGIASMIAPIFFTQVFAEAVGRYRALGVPGAPFLIAAAFLVAAIVVSLRVTAPTNDQRPMTHDQRLMTNDHENEVLRPSI
jgi:hypothetical protein